MFILNLYLHNWFKKNLNLDIKFKEGDIFEQYTFEQLVVYSFYEKTPYDNIFRDLCVELAPSVGEFDDFILSLFHEVGHVTTSDNWSDAEWGAYFDFLDNVPPIPTKEDFINYYNQPIESTATINGMMMIKYNLKAVRKLQKVVKLFER